MALNIPKDQIDLSDPRIREIVCRGCYHMIVVERGSICDQYERCSRCCDELDRHIQRTRQDS